MTRIELPYLWLRPVPSGKTIAYYRRGKATQRIKAPAGRNLLPGNAGFLAAYQALHDAAERGDQGKPGAPQDGTLAALAARYQISGEWRELRASTRGKYARALRDICAQFGDHSANIPRKGVFAIRDAFTHDGEGKPTPARANTMIAVLAALLQWGYNHGEVKENTALRPGKLREGPGFSTWTEEQFWQFMDCPAVGEPIKRAAALAWFTGLRVADCIAVQRSARKGGRIEGITAKTGAEYSVPEHPDLTRILDAAPASVTPTLLTRLDGSPWKIDHVKHTMTDAVRAAGLSAGLSFHGLRKGLTANLAERGATDAEIESVIPHSGQMTRHYRKGADQKKLAGAAIARLPERGRK